MGQEPCHPNLRCSAVGLVVCASFLFQAINERVLLFCHSVQWSLTGTGSSRKLSTRQNLPSLQSQGFGASQLSCSLTSVPLSLAQNIFNYKLKAKNIDASRGAAKKYILESFVSHWQILTQEGFPVLVYIQTPQGVGKIAGLQAY